MLKGGLIGSRQSPEFDPTTENAPAGSRGEFWGYYREERPPTRRMESGFWLVEPNRLRLIPVVTG